MQTTMFFIKTDMLLQEKGFEQLRDFIKMFEESVGFANQYSTLYIGEDSNFNLESPTADFKNSSSLSSAIFRKLSEGYILINLAQLKKLLSC